MDSNETIAPGYYRINTGITETGNAPHAYVTPKDLASNVRHLPLVGNTADTLTITNDRDIITVTGMPRDCTEWYLYRGCERLASARIPDTFLERYGYDLALIRTVLIYAAAKRGAIDTMECEEMRGMRIQAVFNYAYPPAETWELLA